MTELEEPVYEFLPGQGWVAHDRTFLGQLIKEIDGRRIVLTNRMPRPGEYFYSNGQNLADIMSSVVIDARYGGPVGVDWEAMHVECYQDVEGTYYRRVDGWKYKLVVIEIYDLSTGARLQ